jgi:polyribonucleotide nucleotidyltransferase
MVVPRKTIAQIVGKGGANMNALSSEHNVRINIGQDVEGEDDLVECAIYGAVEGCHAVEKLIMEIVNEVVNSS